MAKTIREKTKELYSRNYDRRKYEAFKIQYRRAVRLNFIDLIRYLRCVQRNSNK